MTTNEIPLPTTFRRDSFDFRQVFREGDVAIFEKSKPTHTVPHWEVVIVQHNEAREMAGVAIQARESMPWPESWGKLGWTDLTLDRARNRFRELVCSRLNSISTTCRNSRARF